MQEDGRIGKRWGSRGAGIKEPWRTPRRERERKFHCSSTNRECQAELDGIECNFWQ